MTKEELEKEAREYLAEHSEYSEVFGQTFVAVDTLTAMVEFAVPREKQIAELEQENENLKKTYRKQRNKRIDELQKENAELKEQKEMLEKGYVWHDYDAGEDCYEDTHEGKWVKRDEVYQLAKAKEIIKKLIEAIHIWDCKNLEKVETEAENFLKESEGK